MYLMLSNVKFLVIQITLGLYKSCLSLNAETAINMSGYKIVNEIAYNAKSLTIIEKTSMVLLLNFAF